MNAKALKVLVVVTLVCVFAALAVQKLGSPGAAKELLPERVVPTLERKLNDIAGISITTGGNTVTLAKAGDAWTLTSKDGYPAKFETVKSLLVSLAELKPRERKTADPTLYSRLGLGEPAEGSESLGVRLTAADGSVAADVVLGVQVQSGPTQQRYVRAAGDAQAWLAEGRVDAPTDPMRWLDTAVTQVPRDRITRIEITHPDGEVVGIVREQGGTEYTLEAVPEGRTAKSAGEIGAPASALGYLRFEDVRADESLTDQAGEPAVAVYDTTDDLRITIRTWVLDGKTWASLYAEPIASPAGPSDEPPAEDATEPPAPDPGPAAQAEADALNATCRGWLFAIPDYQATSFRKRLADLTDAPPPDQPAADLLSPDTDEPTFAPFLDAADEPERPAHSGG